MNSVCVGRDSIRGWLRSSGNERISVDLTESIGLLAALRRESCFRRCGEGGAKEYESLRANVSRGVMGNG